MIWRTPLHLSGFEHEVSSEWETAIEVVHVLGTVTMTLLRLAA